MPLTTLGHIDVETFLRDYWQQKPLLIRAAFPDFESPLSPDELAGLSLEDDVESRLILEHGKTPWELRCGPFAERDFKRLPESHWTLLVQAVDHYIPAVTDLLEAFRFLPDWRLDDIMISYAVKGGSVGPHFDQYDVFLLQGAGQRRWQVGQWCDEQSPLLPGTDLSILEEFSASEEFILEPGDMLYLPPQLAHWGVALDDGCLTYSIGFRAPSHAEILAGVLQERIDHFTEFDRFTDPGIALQSNPGLIAPATIEQLLAFCREQLTEEHVLEWFGRNMTQPKYPSPELDPLSDDEMEPFPESGDLQKHPQSRFAYALRPDGMCWLFVDGQQHSCALSLAEALCQNHTYEAGALLKLASQEPEKMLLNTLWQHEHLGFMDDGWDEDAEDEDEDYDDEDDE